MRVYYIDKGDNRGQLVATHTDEQNVDPSTYGPTVQVFTQSSPDIQFADDAPTDAVPMGRLIVVSSSNSNSLDIIRAFAKATILKKITDAEATVTSLYSPAEMLSWGTKDAAARAYLAEQTLTTTQNTLLRAELASSGASDLKELCETITQNADAFAKLCGTLAGLRTLANTDIDTSPTQADIDVVLAKLSTNIQAALNPNSAPSTEPEPETKPEDTETPEKTS